jgi:flagellar hook-associated protein 3 FlgL
MILDFGNSINSNTQYLRQIDAASNQLSSTEDVVSAGVSSIMRLMELTAPSSSGYTAAQLAAIAPEVDSIRDTLLSLANTKAQGKFIFGGSQTQSTPFSDTAGTVNYSGNANFVDLRVAAQATMATNIPGDTLFYGTGGQNSATDIFKLVTDLSDGLKNNDTTAIQGATANLDAVLANFNRVLAMIGGRQSALSSLKDTLSGFNITLQGMQDGIQATDYPKAMTEYTNDTTIQSVTLSTMAKSTKTNLFDYLG